MFRCILTPGTPGNTTKSSTYLPKISQSPPSPQYDKPFSPQLRATANKHTFHPPSKDPYEPTFSDESIELGLEIDMGSDPKNNPENENLTENCTTNTRTRKRAPDAGEKAKAASKHPNVDQQKENTNNQRIVYISFEEERPRISAFANAMIKFTNQRDPGSVREMPMRNGISIKPKNKEASKLLTPQNIKQEFQ